MDFDNKLKPTKTAKPTTRRQTMLDEIKRFKEFGDPSVLGHDHRDFMDYMKEFYGKVGDGFGGGIYAEEWDGGFDEQEMFDALEEYLTNPQKYNQASDFEGDSFDREFIRDIVANKRQGTPIDPLGLNLVEKKGKK